MGIARSLEWNGTYAETPFGTYHITKYGRPWAVYFERDLACEATDEADARVRAQADYESRIASALDPLALQALSRGEGEWVLVPKEPTDEMVQAGLESLAESTGEPIPHIVRDALFCYRAMLRAATPPPAIPTPDAEAK